MNNILFLILGWLLGLLSPVILDWIKNRKKKKELRESFFNDLNDIRGRLIGLVYLTTSKFGNFNRELLE